MSEEQKEIVNTIQILTNLLNVASAAGDGRLANKVSAKLEILIDKL